MKYYSISIGILSYNAPQTLRHTLTTYKNSQLLYSTDDIFCIIQKSEKQVEEKLICEEFNIRAILMPDNGLMSSGFKAIYNNAKYENILFLENDFCTYHADHDVEYYLDKSISLLDHNMQYIRGRSRTNPGNPNHAKQNLCNIKPDIFIKSKHLSECIYWVDNPELLYPTKIQKISSIDEPAWYCSSSSSCNYTNNPYICKKSFFKYSIYPYLDNNHNIETILTPIWSRQNHRCAFGFGIFTHDRIKEK